MNTVIWYGDCDRYCDKLQLVLSPDRYEIEKVSSEEELLRLLSDKECHFFLLQKHIITSDLGSIIRASERDARLTVLLIPYDDELSAVRDFAEEKGFFVVPQTVFDIHTEVVFSLMVSSLNRLSALNREKEKLSHKLIENRLVDRAKCILIQHLKLTELQAHKYIERQAMDLRMSREKVAQIILQTYEQS